MSLYLDPALLQRLAREDPLTRLHAGNVADCWTALEGVSHFLYLAWNAGTTGRCRCSSWRCRPRSTSTW